MRRERARLLLALTLYELGDHPSALVLTEQALLLLCDNLSGHWLRELFSNALGDQAKPYPNINSSCRVSPIIRRQGKQFSDLATKLGYV